MASGKGLPQTGKRRLCCWQNTAAPQNFGVLSTQTQWNLSKSPIPILSILQLLYYWYTFKLYGIALTSTYAISKTKHWVWCSETLTLKFQEIGDLVRSKTKALFPFDQTLAWLFQSPQLSHFFPCYLPNAVCSTVLVLTCSHISTNFSISIDIVAQCLAFYRSLIPGTYKRSWKLIHHCP